MILPFHVISGIFWLINGAISGFLSYRLQRLNPCPYKNLCLILAIGSLFRVLWACNIPNTTHEFLVPMIADTLLHLSQVILLSIVTYLIFKIRYILYQCINYDTFEAYTSIVPNLITGLVVVFSSLLLGFFPNDKWVFRGITYFTILTHAWVLVAISISLIYRWRQALDNADHLRQSFKRLIVFIIVGSIVCFACSIMIILNMIDHSFRNHYIFPITIFAGELVIMCMVNYQAYRCYCKEVIDGMEQLP